MSAMDSSPAASEKAKLHQEEKGVGSGSAHHVEIHEIDGFRVLGLSPEDADFYMNFPREKRKKIYRKIDYRLVPVLAMLYLMAHIDRANIGNAKIEGMVKDLDMTDSQYSTVLAIFFVPYLLFQVPSNVIVERLDRPSRYMSVLVTAWGVVMTLTGVVQDYGGLMGTRVLLGFFESGFFPGAVYLCSFWYMPKKLAVRLSLFYLASALSGAFSGLLAAAIACMDGIGGYQGWRWIFIIEGIFTVLVGIGCWFFLIDTPARSGRWLDPEEIRYLELSMFIKQGGTFRLKDSGVLSRDMIEVLKDWQVYVHGFMLFAQATVLYGFKFTMPTIMKSMGFSTTVAQLVSAPPYVVAAIAAYAVGRLSDRYYWRMPFVAGCMTVIAIGYAILVGLQGDIVNKRGVAYFAVVLATAGTFPTQPASASWCSNNVAPAPRRAVAIGLQICIANLGGILGSFMYYDHDAPKYNTGYGISLALSGTCVIVCFLMEWYYKVANAKKDKLAEQAKLQYTEEELFEMGNKSPLFRHVL